MSLLIYHATNTLKQLTEDLPTTDKKAEATFAILGSKAIDLNEFPKLRGLFRVGVGTENVPFEEARRREISVHLPKPATRDIIYESTADMAVFLILRDAFRDLGDVHSWRKGNRNHLKSLKVLILGAGNIGSRVKDRLLSMCSVFTYDVLENPPEDLDRLLPEADVISIHIPVNDSTRGLIGADKLKRMKPGAHLVNTARAVIVDEQALGTYLEANKLRASFDVFWQEPYTGPLMKYFPDPFFMTPHQSSNCFEFLEGNARDLRDVLAEFGG